jgi:hypothetical protein
MNPMHKVLTQPGCPDAAFGCLCRHRSPQPAAAIPEITIMAHECAFDAPKEIPAGPVRVKLMDQGKDPHHVQFARLNDGVTFEQFTAAR